MEWPGGRVLLQWALDEADLGSADAGTVMTLGEGIGLTAIGLALARERGATHASRAPAPVVATDFCDETLALLRTSGDLGMLTGAATAGS